MGKGGNSSLPIESVMKEVTQLFQGLTEDTVSLLESPHLTIGKRLGLSSHVVLLSLRELQRRKRIGLLELMDRVAIAPEQNLLSAPSMITTKTDSLKMRHGSRPRQTVDALDQEEAPMAEADKPDEQIVHLTRELEIVTKRVVEAEEECDRLRQSLETSAARRAEAIQAMQVLKKEVARLTPVAERAKELERRVADLTAQQNVPDELAAVITAIT